jgi:hypothetical protein
VPKPKDHARTPYILFVADNYSELTRANPGVKLPDLGRMLGQMWRVLPDEQKETYRARFKEEKAIRDADRQAKLSEMTDAEKNEIKAIATEKKRRRSLRQRKKLEKTLLKPKPENVNPFVLFVKAKTVDRGDAPVQMYVKGLSEMWKKMPEDDKEVYVKEARANSARYRQRLAEWERRMIAQNHPELVRQSVIKKAKTAARPRARSAATTPVAANNTKPSTGTAAAAAAKPKAAQSTPSGSSGTKAKSSKKNASTSTEE